ncbi:MAG: GDP-mannose 4,6-dehydratase [Gemmatimonadota bacterium]|nr:MAG: GDP-mannose 4,6-dehydratase [Gemmatimonadota bacterium]
MARFLVTGGAGFIGSHLVRGVLAGGDRVRVLDDLSSGYSENLSEVSDRVDFHRGDVSDPAAVSKAVDGVDYILHHAALASVPRSVEDPWLNHRINVDGTLALLMAARDSGVKRMVLASSAAIYGDDEISPKHEGLPPRPISPYATSKLIGEQYCAQFTACGWVSTVCLRYFNIFGPRQDPGSDYAAVVPIFLNTLLQGKAPVIYGDGGQTRDFTHVDNVVHANLLAVARDSAAGGVFNIGCGGSYSVNQLYERLSANLAPGVAARYVDTRAGDVRVSEASIERARRELGYEVQTGFDEGLESTCEWFRAHPDRARKGASA